MLLMFSGSKKKEPRYACLSEARATHSQRMWAEVLSSIPHLLHNALPESPSRWRCLLRVLCLVRRPVTTLDCILLKDRSLALTPRQRPEINSRACLWVSSRPCHHAQCWLSNQCLILLCVSCLETLKASSGPTNLRTEPSLASSLAISLPRTPACPGTRNSPTACHAEISLTPFGTVGPMETLFWRPRELSKPPDYQSRYSRTSLVYSEIEFHEHIPEWHKSQPERL